MQCENCHAEIGSAGIVCPDCGTIATQEIQGFENTGLIQKQLRAMFTEHRRDALAARDRFIALVKDYVPDHDYDKEQKLLITMFNNDVLKDMVTDTEKNHDIVSAKARRKMIDEIYLAEGAAEFVLVCYTYMLGWPYESPLRKMSEADIQDREKKKAEKKKITMADIEMNVLTTLDTGKYKFPLPRRDIAVPDGITKLDNFCFEKFNSLRTVVLPNSVLAIGESAFSECKNLREVKLPDSIRLIGANAFFQCVKLAAVRLPQGMLEISDSLFWGCTSLETIEVPAKVSSIGSQAFFGCDKLKKLFLPDSVKFIDNEAFAYCPSLVITCYENSYVHKYCLSGGIRCETVKAGKKLRKTGLEAYEPEDTETEEG